MAPLLGETPATIGDGKKEKAPIGSEMPPPVQMRRTGTETETINVAARGSPGDMHVADVPDAIMAATRIATLPDVAASAGLALGRSKRQTQMPRKGKKPEPVSSKSVPPTAGPVKGATVLTATAGTTKRRGTLSV
jgi:hypothetical protein